MILWNNEEACNFIKKETLAQVFSCQFCEIFKNTFFTEYLQTTASNFNWLCKDIKKIKHSPDFILTNSCTEWSL